MCRLPFLVREVGSVQVWLATSTWSQVSCATSSRRWPVKCQELDNAGIGAIHLPGSFYDSGEFVIIEDTVTRSLARWGS